MRHTTEDLTKMAESLMAPKRIKANSLKRGSSECISPETRA